MAEANSYEEQRRRQVEENKRKLEELRLHHLPAAVRGAAVKPSSLVWLVSQKRKAPKPRGAADDAPPRRSGRIATLPEQPDYRDNVRAPQLRGP
ncbi:B3 domain-containing protein Os06g0194400-like [Triticum urartu]|uniref:B3 domain-containing protein Os06g0194400-like n=1 Tax=Triticum urartu TaxID=4572 RepID=UPI002042F3EA|nr:B3 domain-containing protein Os06g0194400-like [Triticum urartu]